MNEPESGLLASLDGAVLTLTISRPGRRNALTRELIAALDAALRAANGATESDVRGGGQPHGSKPNGGAPDGGIPNGVAVNCIVLCGADGTFSSGVDLDAAVASDGPPFPEILTAITATIRSIDVPVIAAIEGPAYGAGLALALAADLRVVADDARLCEAYIRIGRFAGGGDTYWLPQVVGSAQALRMLWTGDVVSGSDAVGIGLAEVCVPPGGAVAAAQEMASKIAAAPPGVIGRTKRAVYDLPRLSQEAALAQSVALSARGESDV